MLPQDSARFAPVVKTLKDGRSITLRLLEQGDAEALGDFYESVPREDYRFYRAQKLTRAMGQRMAREQADSDNLVCVVGVYNAVPAGGQGAAAPTAGAGCAERSSGQAAAGQIVGYAWYDWKEPTDPMSRFGICIRRGYQDGGTGRILMTRMLEIAREVGPPLMNLTVQKANVRAVALYQKMGFHIVREQMRGPSPEFETEPEYYMEQSLR
jgi:ribosomal protein S18 acetylase RimI-like enzyme